MLALGAGGLLALVTWLVLLLQAMPGSDEPLSPPDWQGQPLGATPQMGLPAPGSRPQGRAPRAERIRKDLEPERPLGPEAVIGRVRDRLTGEAVGAFQVDVLPHAAGSPLERLADSLPQPFHVRSGIFRIDHAEGSWDVVVRAPGYEPGFVQGVELPAADHKPIPFELDRGAGITGVVRDRANQAMPRIKVFLHVQRLDDPEDKPPRLTIAHTGLDGRFHFTPLPPGEYGLSLLELDNTVDFRGGIRVRLDGQTVEVPMLLTDRHQLQIVVRDPRNQPVDGARIELRGGGHYSSAATNGNGMAVLEHVPDGSYTATASQRGFETATDTFELSGGSGHLVRWISLSPVRDD